MLQNLKAKVEGEGAKERELHDKYMCYCKNGAASLEKSVADAGPKVTELESSISEAEARKAQMDQEIANHKADQVGAKEAMTEATALREKGKAAFDQELADAEAELGPINEALVALAHGLGGSFIQSSGAQVLKKVVQAKNDMNDGDRSELISFLADNSEYAPADGEIIGILNGMKDQVNEDIAALNTTETTDIANYEGLMAAKEKELEPIQAMVEDKLLRASKIPVEITEMKNDLGDTGEQIVEDKKFLSDLSKNCATKQKFFDENVRMRGQEIEALADTIKVLNDDDALELFKKTNLPGASSFLQISESTSQMRARALSVLSGIKHRNVGVDFIVLSLQGKKKGSDKVIKLITDLTAALKKEGQDDADKKVYCAKQFDESDDKKKVLETEVNDHESTISDLETVPNQLTSEIDALGDGIRELDKSVAEATEQRKEEADAYAPLMANDATAKDLILFAKNRLNKFYNPKLYKPPVQNLSDEDRAVMAAGGTLAPAQAGGIAGTGIGLNQLPPPPQAIEAYSKKSEESGGVIALMDLLVKELDKEMIEAEMTEKNAQEDYQNFMSDAAEKRQKDAQAMSDKEGVLADTKARLLEAKDAKAASTRNLMAVEQFISSLHSECDWLIKYFDMRKEARNGEIEAMTKAKAILSGADYSFLQTGARTLRR
jgi:septal ring factor EnvC (AmiA/AmiB activator)